MVAYIIIPMLAVCNALSDAFYDEKKEMTSSLFKSLYIAAIGLILGLGTTWWHLWYFVLCWWVFFDPTYNLVRRAHGSDIGLFYVGHTKWTDKLIRLIFRDNSPHFSWVSKILFALPAAISLILTGRI